MNSNQSDGPQTVLLHMRDSLHRRGFKKLAYKYATKVPPRLRFLFEYGVLMLACLSLFTLSYLHIVSIQKPINCLESVEDGWFRDGILRVEIVDSDHQPLGSGEKTSGNEYQNDDEDKTRQTRDTTKFDLSALTNVTIDSTNGLLDSTQVNGYQSFLDENLSHLQMLARIGRFTLKPLIFY